MKQSSVRYQTMVLTATNICVRALGFFLRVALGRLLGAEALGIMELSHSAHMLSIAPVTAGLPLAVSRLTAKQNDDSALRAGKSLVLRISAVMIPLWLLLSPVAAYLLGDMRTLPALWVFTPCIVVLGLCAVYNGYCYGRGLVYPPALSELSEQGLRFLFTAALLQALPTLSVRYRAAVPGLCTLLAESVSLLLMIFLLRKTPRTRGKLAPMRRQVWALSLPLTASRLLTTALRAATGALLPRRLVASGLTCAQAAAALGMLQGMVLPVLFLPGVFTSALGMVGAPAMARREGRHLRALTLRLLFSALLCGLCGAGGIRALAGFLSTRVYHMEALTPLFVAASPLTLLFSLQQAASALLSGLGQQKKTLLPAIVGAALTLFLLYRFAALPQLRLHGAIYAMLMGQALTVLCELGELFLLIRPARPATRPDD